MRSMQRGAGREGGVLPFLFPFLDPCDLLVTSQICKKWNSMTSLTFRDALATYFGDLNGVLVPANLQRARAWYLAWRRQVLPIQA